VNPDRWRIVTEIFHAALDRPTAQRPQYVSDACREDPTLRADVDALLAGEARAAVVGEPFAIDRVAMARSAGLGTNSVDPRIDEEPIDASMLIAPGTHLGPYEILGALGAGGMGEVYRARDGRLDRAVAIKVLRSQGAADADARARFDREARAIASLSHPNICAVFDVGHDAGRDYLVMELLEGETLQQRLTRGPLTMAALVDNALALADALESAHARGLIHRDLTPANIFLTTRDQPKILDFGLVKMVRVADDSRLRDSGLTGTAAVVGTLAYMSPEQLRGEPLDPRTDLFSFGLVLYEMATGQRAFSGSTSAVVSAAILGQEPAAPRTLRADLPSQLDEAILKLLEKDRVVRCQTAAELRADLFRIKRQMQSHRGGASGSPGAEAVRAPPSAAPVAADVADASSSSDAQVISGLIGRHRQGLWFGALALAGVLGALGYLTWRLAVTPPMNGQAPEPSNIEIRPLTFTGNVTLGAISPDGKFVAYVRSDEQSLWVRQTSTGNDVRIVPSEAGTDFLSLTVTPDSSYVDFVARKAATDFSRDLWRVPFLGGTPRKLASLALSGVGWSPDGRLMAFVRNSPTANGTASLVMIADAEGSHERVLAKRLPAKYFGDSLAWSPDGSAIAVIGSTQGRLDASNTDEIVVLDVATGDEREVIAEPVDLAGLAWLDSTHLLTMRDTATTDNTQPMIMDLRNRRSTPLTRDPASYRGVSLTADRLTAVSTRTDTRAGVWLGGASGEQMALVVPESSAAPRQLSISNTGVIAYLASSLEAAAAIWTVRSGELPHIVVGSGWPAYPAIAPRGDLLVFASDEPGGIYRVSLDGTHPTKLTDTRGGPIALTPDGAVALFAAGYHLWSVPVAGGAAREISSRSTMSRPVVSPDGRRVAFFSGVIGRRYSIICDLPDCTRVREQPFLFPPAAWTPDGHGFAYLNPQQPANIWVQPIDGGPARPLTRFTDRRIRGFAWSPDGTRLAVARATVLSDLVLIKGFK